MVKPVGSSTSDHCAPVISDRIWKSLIPGQAIMRGAKAVATRVEGLADRVVGREEALIVPRQLNHCIYHFRRRRRW